jgi:hypothetical protein
MKDATREIVIDLLVLVVILFILFIPLLVEIHPNDCEQF